MARETNDTKSTNMRGCTAALARTLQRLKRLDGTRCSPSTQLQMRSKYLQKAP